MERITNLFHHIYSDLINWFQTLTQNPDSSKTFIALFLFGAIIIYFVVDIKGR